MRVIAIIIFNEWLKDAFLASTMNTNHRFIFCSSARTENSIGFIEELFHFLNFSRWNKFYHLNFTSFYFHWLLRGYGWVLGDISFPKSDPKLRRRLKLFTLSRFNARFLPLAFPFFSFFAFPMTNWNIQLLYNSRFWSHSNYIQFHFKICSSIKM